MPILHLPTSEKTRPKVIRRYARRRVQAIQHGIESYQEIPLEVSCWVWRPEGSYPVLLKERLNSYSIPRRDCLGSNGALFRPQLVQATTKNGGIKFLKFNCSLSKRLTP
ncbi:MAG: hypothetical protein HWN65_19310 [Candidatus Helarchaeota archaeon]|nr:hypothetical protein [Candidatus Helarchaeota archaeon]